MLQQEVNSQIPKFVFKQQFQQGQGMQDIRQIVDNIKAKQDDTINLQHGKWHLSHMSQILAYILQWNNRRFFFRHNPQPKLLQQISQIKFNRITLLAIQDNQIQSLQIFSTIWMPGITSLGIQRNRIRTINNMRKAYVQNLRDFGIAGNNILDCQKMINFQSYSFTMIGIQTKGLRQQSPNICWLAKLETKNHLTHTYFRSPSRIKYYTQKILRHLKQKHIKIDARLHNVDQERGINLRI